MKLSEFRKLTKNFSADYNLVVSEFLGVKEGEMERYDEHITAIGVDDKNKEIMIFGESGTQMKKQV